MNNNQVGKNYERHVVHKFNDAGFNGVRRGQQYCGANGDADVVGADGIHIECKRITNGLTKLYNAISQSKGDAKENEVPVVIAKSPRCNDLVIMEFDDWIEMYKEWTR